MGMFVHKLIIFMPGLNALGLQSKLHHLVNEAIIINYYTAGMVQPKICDHYSQSGLIV